MLIVLVGMRQISQYTCVHIMQCITVVACLAFLFIQQPCTSYYSSRDYDIYPYTSIGWCYIPSTCNVILEVEMLSSDMLKCIFRLIHIHDIIINHFLISYLVHTCCSLVWYLDTQCCGPVSLGIGPVTPNAGSVTLYTFPVLTISVRYYGVYYRYQLIFLHGSTCWLVKYTNFFSNWSTFRVL